jgi:hypothetical protein
MTTITICLSDEEVACLRELADEAKVPPEELLQVRVKELLHRPKEEFLCAAAYVLKKNAELYKGLA